MLRGRNRDLAEIPSYASRGAVSWIVLGMLLVLLWLTCQGAADYGQLARLSMETLLPSKSSKPCCK
jgi:hypothetical protein